MEYEQPATWCHRPITGLLHWSKHILTGLAGGFEVGFMVDAKDWTHGPFMSLQGFSVLVHDPSDDVVLLENRGIFVPVGATVNLMINKLAEKRLVTLFVT